MQKGRSKLLQLGELMRTAHRNRGGHEQLHQGVYIYTPPIYKRYPPYREPGRGLLKGYPL